MSVGALSGTYPIGPIELKCGDCGQVDREFLQWAAVSGGQYSSVLELRRLLMEQQTTETVTIYEPPVLVELGEFCEDTLGFGQDFPDNLALQAE